MKPLIISIIFIFSLGKFLYNQVNLFLIAIFTILSERINLFTNNKAFWKNIFISTTFLTLLFAILSKYQFEKLITGVMSIQKFADAISFILGLIFFLNITSIKLMKSVNDEEKFDKVEFLGQLFISFENIKAAADYSQMCGDRSSLGIYLTFIAFIYTFFFMSYQLNGVRVQVKDISLLKLLIKISLLGFILFLPIFTITFYTRTRNNFDNSFFIINFSFLIPFLFTLTASLSIKTQIGQIYIEKSALIFSSIINSVICGTSSFIFIHDDPLRLFLSEKSQLLLIALIPSFLIFVFYLLFYILSKKSYFPIFFSMLPVCSIVIFLIFFFNSKISQDSKRISSSYQILTAQIISLLLVLIFEFALNKLEFLKLQEEDIISHQN